MLRIFYLTSLSIFLSACAGTGTAGISKIGPDTYTISTYANPMNGGGGGAKKRALDEANSQCQSEQKEILVTNISIQRDENRGVVTGRDEADITFRCLAKGDPSLQRPTLRNDPTVVIEDRRK
jgi:hypothetical protein